MIEKNTCVVCYKSIDEVDEAICKLVADEFDMRSVSIIGDKTHYETYVVSHRADKSADLRVDGVAPSKTYPKYAFANAVLLDIPGLGTLMAAGSIVVLLHADNSDIDIHGLDPLGLTLFSLGIPVVSVIRYEDAIRGGELLLIINANRVEVERSCNILHNELRRATVHLA